MNSILSHIRILSICLLTLLLTNCEVPWLDNGHSLMYYNVVIIKLGDSTYKNKILAYLRDDRYATGKEVPTMSMRYNMCVAHPLNMSAPEWIFDFPESPRVPYWELADGWLLIDWRWPLYPYNRSSSVIIDRGWNDYFNGIWKYSRDEIIDYDPIVGWINIPIDKVAKCMNKKYSNTTYNLVNAASGSGSHLNRDDYLIIDGQSVCLCEIPNVMDSIWSELQTDLSNIITSKGIKELYR